MRYLAIFPLLCCITSLILSLLCIFAGSRTDFLPDYDLFTLNTSMIGEALLDNATDASITLPPALQQLQPELERIQQSLRNGTLAPIAEGVVKSLAQALNLHDFYAAHVLDYCEGYYEPTALANASFTPSKNITRCSPLKTSNNLNATQILQDELTAGVLLTEDLQWPPEITQAVQTVNTAANVMVIMYCVGAGLVALCALGALFTVFASGLLGPCVNLLLDLVAAAALVVASAIATALAVVITNAANQYGAQIGISAYRGDKFLALTWAATALMIVAVVGWLVDCCTGRHRRKYTTVQPYKGDR